MSSVSSQIRALVVGDGLAGTVAETLADEYGIEATHATSTEAALEAIDGGAVDCVVIDAELPDSDGSGLLEALRERDGRLPAVLLSDRGGDRAAMAALEDEFADYMLRLEVAEDEQYERLAGRIESVVARRRARNDLRRHRERLESLTGVVSHDLRNPLNVAQSSVELLEDCESPHLDRLDRSLVRIGDIIDDVVTLAREGDPVAEPSPVDLARMAGDAWTGVDAGDATLEADVDLRIEADSGRLRALLGHLFENAVEHGSDVSTVTVGAADGGFFVADDGDGIRDDYREDVFEAGFSTARGGTGLGLAIVREIASAHGWAVEVGESESGGARFDVVGVAEA